jgi:hypothetical protein
MNKILMILALTLPAAAFASADAKYQLGTEARAWTDLQKNGRASLGSVRPLPTKLSRSKASGIGWLKLCR